MKIGYRGWKVSDTEVDGELRPILVSPFRSTFWYPPEIEAECPGAPPLFQQELTIIDILATHMEECHCGIYSLKTVQDVCEQYSSDIIGEVLLYGTIIEGERGFRASKAKVGTLFLPDELDKPNDLFKALAEYYKVSLIKSPKYSSDLLREPLIFDDSMLKHITSMQSSTQLDPIGQQWTIDMIFESNRLPRLNPMDVVSMDMNVCGVHIKGEAFVRSIQNTGQLGGMSKITVELQSALSFADRITHPNCRSVIITPPTS